MSATIIDGKGLALKVRARGGGGGRRIRRVGLPRDDPRRRRSGLAHLRREKHKASAEAGIEGRDHRFPATTPESEILDLIADLNADDRVDGILVQLPLPEHMDEAKVTYAVDPGEGRRRVPPAERRPPLPGHAVARSGDPARRDGACCDEYDVELEGTNAVVIGRSEIVGKPMAMLLLLEHATVTICHSRTRTSRASRATPTSSSRRSGARLS